MDKKAIAKIIKEMAVLMEIKGDNPFKIRAHHNAVRILEGLTESLPELVASGEITNIKGIGKGMADKIMTLLNGEELSEYQQLKDAIPPGLLEIAKIPGLGPKKVKMLWKDLNITTPEALEAACEADQLSGVKGFGAKTQEKILESIAMLKKFQGRHSLPVARNAADTILDALSGFPGVIRVEVAGSLRRWKETVKDIDFVLSAADEDREKIMAHFTGLAAVEKVVASGETKSTVILDSGISVDLRIVEDGQFPYLLHHSTGSKEHNVAMRQLAKDQGKKISEYGLFQGEALIPCETEADIFRELGLDYIPPELRENYGEIEAAAAGELPELVEMADMKGMIHTHSVWSDGANTVEEMALAAKELGYEYLVISDHSKAAAYANGLNETRVKAQHEEIDALNEKIDNFRIFKSIECDILADGSLDFSDEILVTFDMVIASIHSKFGMSEPEATDRLIRAIQNPHVTILGHPTGRLLLARDGYPINHHAVIDAAAELGVSIEINANPRRLDLDWRFCKYARDKGLMISINPDAHRIAGYADVEYGVGIARKGWLRKRDILNTYSAEEVLAFANKRRER